MACCHHPCPHFPLGRHVQSASDSGGFSMEEMTLFLVLGSLFGWCGLFSPHSLLERHLIPIPEAWQDHECGGLVAHCRIKLFVCPGCREQPCVSQGSGEGSRNLILLAANSRLPQPKGTPSPAVRRKPASAAELARLPPPTTASLCSLLHSQEATVSSGETTAWGGEGWQYPAPRSAGRSPVCW